MNIGDLVMRVLADMSRFRGDLLKAADKDGTAAGQTLGQKMKAGISGAFKGGKGELLGALGLGAGIGLAVVGLQKLIGVMGDSIQAASDQREAFSLTDQVFEGNTDRMKEWGAEAAQAFGQSTTEALTFASNFGTAFKNVGFSLDDTADKAQIMTRLAADLGSAMNATGEEAATALRSGLLGESEPLRRFGVFLSEAAVQAEALNSGIAEQGEKLTDNQKVLARYNIIMRQTKDSQGAFGRDTGSLADAQKKLEASFTDAQAALGEALRPAMIGIVNFINENFIPAVKDLGEALAGISEGAADNSEALGNLANILYDLFKDPNDDARTFLGTVFDGMNTLIGFRKESNGLRDDLHGGVTGGFRTATKAAADLETGFDDVTDAATDSSQTIIRTVGEMVTQLLGQAQSLITGYFDPIETRADIYQARLEQNAAEEALRDATTAKGKREATNDIMASIRRQADGLTTLGKQGNLTEADIATFEKNVKNSFTALGNKVPAEVAEIIRSLRRLDEWDGKVVNVGVRSTYTGPQGGGYEHRAAGGPVSAGTPYIVGENRPELFVPRVSGTIRPRVRADDRAGMGGNTYQVNVQGLLRARTASDIGDNLRRLADFGVLAPRSYTDG